MEPFEMVKAKGNLAQVIERATILCYNGVADWLLTNLSI